MKPTSMRAVVGGRRYTTDKSILLAHDVYLRYAPVRHTHNKGTNTFLFVTDNGNYFKQLEFLSHPPKIVPLTMEEAIELYERDLPMKEVLYERAFPNVKVVEA